MMLLYVIFVDIPLLVITVIVRLIKAIAKQLSSEEKSRPAPANKGPDAKASDLTAKEREKMVTAILESNLLLNDTCYDSLIHGESAVYPAKNAVNTDSRGFKLQYGSKEWIAAWRSALERFFDCKSKYCGKGEFLCYGKEV